MAQVFGRSANSLARAMTWGVLVLVFGATGMCQVVSNSSISTAVGVPVTQPIPFSHKHHVGDDAIDCRYCHTSVENSPFAGMPSATVCMNCHRQIWAESPTLQPVREAFENGTPIEWQRVNSVPDFVFFDHSIHVQKGVGCVSCHGQIDDMPRTMKAQSLQMSFCLDCHRNPEKYVRPKDQVFNLHWQPPDQMALGTSLVHEYGIRRLTDCTTCHR